MSGKLHIHPHQATVDKNMRSVSNMHKPVIVWFTGLSGSGKSTLANALELELHKKGVKTYLLDGDNIRTGLNADLDFSLPARKENIRRIGEIAKLFVDAGMVVLAAFVSPLRSDRDNVRSLVEKGEFVEVFVDCPIEECEKRDVKGLYAKARKGIIKDFTGISSPFEAPLSAEITISTQETTISDGLNQLINVILPIIKKGNFNTP